MTETAAPKPRQPWHQSISFLVVVLLVVGPFAIPLIWVNRKIAPWLKVILTLAMIGLSVLLIRTTTNLVRQVQDQIKSLQQIY